MFRSSRIALFRYTLVSDWKWKHTWSVFSPFTGCVRFFLVDLAISAEIQKPLSFNRTRFMFSLPVLLVERGNFYFRRYQSAWSTRKNDNKPKTGQKRTENESSVFPTEVILLEKLKSIHVNIIDVKFYVKIQMICI